MKFLNKIYNEMSRSTKIFLLTFLDFLIIFFSLLISIFIIEQKSTISLSLILFTFISFMSFLTLFYLLGMHKYFIRFIDVNYFFKINQLTILHFLLVFFFFHIAKKFFPYSESYFSILSTKQIFIHYLLY
mgnify:CR=1 FL=1